MYGNRVVNGNYAKSQPLQLSGRIRCFPGKGHNFGRDRCVFRLLHAKLNDYLPVLQQGQGREAQRSWTAAEPAGVKAV